MKWQNLATFSVLVILVTGCGIQSIPTQLQEVDAAWAEVLNQYKRRADLVPQLVETVKGYAKHESQTLQGVTDARAKATQMQIDASQLTEENLKKFQEAQLQLKSALGRLLAIAENYPDLKASQNFRDLQTQLEGTENRITVARQRYIEAIKRFNVLVTVFPTNLTNKVFFSYTPKPQFTVEDEKQIAEPPKVTF